MTLPPTVTSDQDAAPAVTPPAKGWQRWLDNDPLVYSITFCVMVACCLLVPKLLNNMIFVFVMLMIGIVIVPAFLRRQFGAPRDKS